MNMTSGNPEANAQHVSVSWQPSNLVTAGVQESTASSSRRTSTDAGPAEWERLVEKVQAYLQGELSLTVGDYRLLEQMNNTMHQKYDDMVPAAQQVQQTLQNLNERFRSLQPFVDKIEQMEMQVLELEKTAYSLDAYSRQLEARFKALKPTL